MENTVIDSNPLSYKRQRYLSCPAINNKDLPTKLRPKLPRVHRQSFIYEFSCAHSDYSTLKSSASEPTQYSLLHPDQIGVKAFDNWRPRKNSSGGEKDASQSIASRATCTINEDRVLNEMNLDTKRVLEPSKFDDINWYKIRNGQDNPFRSDLFLRVLYLIGSVNTEVEENSSSIQNQFLTEEQIMENRLKEQRVNVERLKHELASNDCHNAKSGNVTPAERIYQRIPKIIQRNSYSSPKLEHMMSNYVINSDDNKDSSKRSTDDIVECYLESHNFSSKDSHRLTGREKSIFAPLTF